ncbi:NADPH2:quinone reductase [Hamadaea flava]|uniref:Zinc-binding alcohol dehydrogenase family protein n=1 Tax=Hamadaea flava TaxID=1742688 RepID=A0ABV8LQL3_9ACTN|nr:zinc-binding dehydrogenase [Hamadaea flava]MCP2322650.1 NADPH2:quinone reductase [Hamadaea flava]
MRAIHVRRFGGPEVLTVTELPDPVAGPGQLLVRVLAAGVNYADTHRTDGSYRAQQALPFVPGTEVVGLDADGRRLLAPVFPGGAYAELAVVAEDQAVEVPPAVSDGAALALLVQGMTAWHVLRSSARLAPGESVVVTAAAGGVGSLAVQLARRFGAGRIIAAASTADKRALAAEFGAHATVDSSPDGFADRVIAANGGRPVDVVLESTGGPLFTESLAALGAFGRLVTFGNASRQGRPPVDPAVLAEHNRAVAGFWLRPVLDDRRPLHELLALAADGAIRPAIGREYALADARQAHEDLLARRTVGKLVLRP